MAGLLMRTLLAGGAGSDKANMSAGKRNLCLGYIAVICATLLALTPPAAAFDAPSRIDRSLNLNSQCGLVAFVHDVNGGLASVRVRPLGGGTVQTQAAGGASYFNGGVSTTFSAITSANLEAHCSLKDVAGLVQQGAAGTYAAHGYMGVSFEATRTSDGARYAYRAEISGVTGTTASVGQTLVNAAPTVSLGSLSGPDGSGKYTVIATLSESSSDFTSSSLTLTNATATVSGSGSSFSIVLTPLMDGEVSVSVPKEGFTDSGGLANWVASNEVTFSADITAPTVSIGAFTGPLNGAQSAVITLSEASTDFTLADLTLTNANATLSGSGTSYTAVLTPLADGSVALSVAAGTFSDAAGNMNAAASNEVTTTYDGTAPVIRPIGDISFEADPSGTRRIGFSTIVDDNVDSGISPIFSLNGVVIATPYDFPIGANLIKINATDSAGNQAVEEEFTITITPGAVPDSPVLTTTVINTNRSMTIGGTAEADGTVRITFPDASVQTVTATGGTFSVTSAADMTGGTVSVTVENSLGYVSPAATVDLFPDYDAPTISIGAFTGPLNGAQSAEITLSEASTDFTLADLSLTNASATLSGSGTSYTAVLTPVADGSVTLSVAAGTFSDAAGNVNATASNEVTTAYDATAPTISIAPFTGPLNGVQSAEITLSEASTDFTLADLSLTNASATLSGSGTSYTAVLTPLADGSVTLSVAAGTFSDAAGNVNAAASNEVTTAYDATAPTISIAPFTGPLNGVQSAEITLSEASTDFTLADLSLTNASATLSGSGTSYTAVLTPLADGSVALSVAAGSFRDAAGNVNAAASNEVTTTYDATAPSVSISSSSTTFVGAASIEIAITFSENVIGFAASDISVANGTVTNLSGSGADYLATVTTTGKGDTEISIPAAVATDVADNSNTASNTLSISNAVVEKTQKVIAQFIQSRATQLIASQPNLTGFLSGSNTGAMNLAVTRGRGDFDFASAPDAANGIWARLTGSWTHEDTRNTRYTFGVIGSHVKLSPNLLIGGMIEFDFLSQEDGASRIDGHGWLIGPYFVARSPAHPLFFEGMLLYGQTKNDISPFGTYSDRFETQRLLAQFKVTGEIDQGRTTWMPSVQLSYTTDTQKAYTDGLGNLIPEQGFELTQAELGLDVRHQVRLPRRSGTLELTGGLAFVGSSTKGSGNAALVVPEYEGGRGKLKAGANYTLPNRGVLTVDAFYDGIGTAVYESFGVQFGFNLTF
ncbi:Ig-like domain-containing protein [Pseudophaeobacter profundi]|uniref:Ig-like domain-containing protein n=1 Tax=Pseudophaeobacter profundi TaxID=3034152 RepID=UPI0024330C5A|nr:Ig-like domain-containing protein [Pseudophaeobacter profundi]